MDTQNIMKLCFGTYQLQQFKCKEAVEAALRSGFRHIDTASCYRNEEIIGDVLQSFISLGYIQRRELYIATKLSPNKSLKDEASTIKFVNQSLANLKVDYLDQVLIHWPGIGGLDPSSKYNAQGRAKIWKGLEQCVQSQKVANIGVSNFQRQHLQEILESCEIMPTVNQIEYHPLCQSPELVQYCQQNSIIIEAYSPVAQADKKLISSKQLKGICSNRNGQSAFQILIKWNLQKGNRVIIKASSEEKIQEDWQAQYIESLNNEEMSILDSMDIDYHVCWNSNKIL